MTILHAAVVTGEVYLGIVALAVAVLLLVLGGCAFAGIFMRPRPPLDALATAVTCTACCRLPRGSCSCSAHCGHKRCAGRWHKALPKRTPARWTDDELAGLDGRSELPL